MTVRYGFDVAEVQRRRGLIWIEVRGHPFIIGRYREGMTRGEVRRLARLWLSSQQRRWRFPNVFRLR